MTSQAPRKARNMPKNNAPTAIPATVLVGTLLSLLEEGVAGGRREVVVTLPTLALGATAASEVVEDVASCVAAVELFDAGPGGSFTEDTIARVSNARYCSVEDCEEYVKRGVEFVNTRTQLPQNEMYLAQVLENLVAKSTQSIPTAFAIIRKRESFGKIQSLDVALLKGVECGTQSGSRSSRPTRQHCYTSPVSAPLLFVIEAQTILKGVTADQYLLLIISHQLIGSFAPRHS
jgi:hypothetical protein